MIEEKMVKINVDGIDAEISEDLIRDMMAMHGVDVLKEVTAVLEKEVAKESLRNDNKGEV